MALAVPELDAEALRALRAAARSANPPEALVEDGAISFRSSHVFDPHGTGEVAYPAPTP
jgi:hypothetical protein